MLQDPILAREAKRLLSTYESINTNRLAVLDPLGNRLVQRLVALGLLSSDACHIEWAGVAEHGVIPIFHGAGGIVQVYENGEAEVFH